MAELGDFFALALRRLQRIRDGLSPRHGSSQVLPLLDHAHLVQQTAQIIDGTCTYGHPFGWGVASSRPAATGLDQDAVGVVDRLSRARGELLGYLPQGTGVSEPRTALGRELGDAAKDAARLLRVGRNLVGAHFGPDGQPWSIFGPLLDRLEARRYLLGRIAEVARHLSPVVGDLADHAQSGTRWRLNQARRYLEKADLLGQHAARGATGYMASLPTAARGTPAPIDAQPRLWYLAQLSFRLQHDLLTPSGDPDAPALSASDLFLLTRPLAISHLAAAGMLGAADQHPDAGPASTSLAEAAQAWHHAARVWHRIADLDGSGLAPGMSAERSSPFQGPPQPHVHPAVANARTLADYLTRQHTDAGSAGPRKSFTRLDSGGGRLKAQITALRPVPASACALAERTPDLLAALRSRLASEVEGTAAAGGALGRAGRGQLLELHRAYRTAAHTSANADRRLDRLAARIGAPHARSALDAAMELRHTVQPQPGLGKGMPRNA